MRYLVESVEGLFEKYEPRAEHESASDRRALAHAARELPGASVREAAEPDQVEQRGRCRLVHGVAARDFERETHVRENVEPRKQDRILEDDPEEAVPSSRIRS